jgi:uncharacterized protein
MKTNPEANEARPERNKQKEASYKPKQQAPVQSSMADAFAKARINK